MEKTEFAKNVVVTAINAIPTKIVLGVLVQKFSLMENV
jgi:hypothetical protein